MLPLERIPAVRRIAINRDDAFAIDITGEVFASDAENLCGLLEGAYALHDCIDLLVRLRDIEGVDFSDLSPETARLMRDEMARHVSRCAVVGVDVRASPILRLFEPAVAVDIRHFAENEEVAAWAWIGAREVDAPN